MKRREFIKAGLTVGGLLIPSKAESLEVIANGKIIDTLSEQPVENAKLSFYSYPENELISEHMTNSNGEYNTVPIAVGYDKWIDIKKLFNDNPEFDNLRKIALEKRVAKRANNGILKLEIKHDNYFDAVRYIDLSKNEFNTDIISKTFDMELFDMWCRSINGCTQRWEEQPKWYIDVSPAYGSDKEVTQDKIDLVREIIQDDLIKFTNSFISNPHIEEGREPPISNPNGWIFVNWDDNYIGSGYHSEELNGNKIYSGLVAFSTRWFERDTYIEELTQVLGPRTETETRYFWDLETGVYLPIAKDIGKILFKRPIGSRSPDVDLESF